MEAGDFVVFKGATDGQTKWGNNDDPRTFCTPGQAYEVESVDVRSWHTKIRLVGVPGRFNSVCFVRLFLDHARKSEEGGT